MKIENPLGLLLQMHKTDKMYFCILIPQLLKCWKIKILNCLLALFSTVNKNIGPKNAKTTVVGPVSS